MNAAATRPNAPPAPPAKVRWQRRWKGLFDTPLNASLSVATLGLVYALGAPFVRWALIDATWTGPADACSARGGACWAFIAAKFRFILFGLYPPDRQFRPLLALVLLIALVGVTAVPRFWHRRLAALWAGGLTLAAFLMSGGGLLPTVRTDLWGGFTLTVLLFLASLCAAFPLAVVLAFGRRSAMGGIRLLSILFIEIVRGVPFIVVLYAATLLLPLMLPPGLAIDQLLRALLAFVLFIAAFLAEVIRGGLQAIPPGQLEAAKALGLSFGQTVRLILLPQALRLVIPAIVGIALNVFQDTSLIMVIGLFDFLNAARIAAADPQWLGFYDEAYCFAALVYFLFCFAGSRYSLWLEARVNVHRR